MPDQNTVLNERRSRLLMALLLALTLAVFLPVCRMAFLDWDDPLHTYENPYLDPLTLDNLAHFWRGTYKGEYVPVCYMAFAFLSVFGQSRVPVPTPSGGVSILNPHAFHTANLVLHLVNVTLVYLLLRRLVRHDAGAFAGALLFAVHPVQVEPVAWISELRGLLAGSCGLSALHLYLSYAQSEDSGRRRRWTCYGGALALFVLALLAKPSSVALPALAWLLDRGAARRSARQSLVSLVGWIAALLPIVLLTRTAQPVPSALHLPLWQRPLIAADALAFYLSKLLLPLRLGIDYGRTPSAVLHSGAALWAGPAVTLLIALLAWRQRRAQPWLPVALGLFVAALLPVLGFVPFMFQNFSTVADRYLYLAMLGPALLVAAGTRNCRPAHAAAFGAFLICCLSLSRAQTGVWRDSGTLFENALAVNPRSPQMHFNLGDYDAVRRRLGDSIREYHEAIRLRPDYPQAYCNLGAALAYSGRGAEALPPLREAVRLEPNLAAAHLGLGLQMLNQGDLGGASREWRETLRLNPDDALARYNLGCALFRTRPAEAAAQFREVLRLEPDYPPALQALRRLARKKT